METERRSIGGGVSANFAIYCTSTLFSMFIVLKLNTDKIIKKNLNQQRCFLYSSYQRDRKMYTFVP